MDKVEKISAIEAIRNEVPRKYHYGLLREDKPLERHSEEFRQVYMGEWVEHTDERTYERDMKDFLIDLYHRDALFHNIIRALENKYWDEFKSQNYTGRVHPLEFLMRKHFNELMLAIARTLYEQNKEYENKEIERAIKGVIPNDSNVLRPFQRMHWGNNSKD